jgi:chemotaxis protein MotB
MAELESEFQDQIIIKRRANTEMETPKGGVWKIAFADFMTAMMCFFLVMWLINAANEDTRQAVASYFNPVRLAELNRKGLANPHVAPEDQPKDGEQTKDSAKPGEAPPKEERGDVSRDALFKDPYKVLAEIAGKADPSGDGYSTGGASGLGGSGTDATREFRDPFDPFFSESASENAGSTEQAAASAETLRPTLSAPDGEASAGSAEKETAARETGVEELETPAGPLQSTPDSKTVAAMPAGSVPMSSAEEGTAPPVLVSAPAAVPEEKPRSEELKQLVDELKDVVQKESGLHRAPGVAVEETGEGVMISLTDEADFGMFDIGSAQPQPELVRIMEKVAAILKEQSGLITIRGHTDGRPFRTAAYDNWRLSTDRAQMAYYMLVRGGLDEHRVESIEGFADRKLKVPSDPDAAENRRIEILLREVTL